MATGNAGLHPFANRTNDAVISSFLCVGNCSSEAASSASIYVILFGPYIRQSNEVAGDRYRCINDSLSSVW